MLSRTIEVKTVIDQKLFAAASRAAICIKSLKQVLIITVLGTLVTLASLFVWSQPDLFGPAGLLYYLVPIFWGALVLLYLIMFVLYPWQAARALKGHPLPLETTWRIREEGVDIVSPAAEAKLDWSHWVKWAESKEFIFLFQTQMVFNVIPKRDFARAEDADAVRELLGRKFAGKK